ncbi:MAG: LAGLIDADG family homing endonuclease [Nitrospiraceae bacterium]
MIIGKGRQQFVTTLTELLDGHRIFFYRDVNCFTASADRDKSAEMMRKVLFCYDNMPWWLKPKHTRRVENIPGMLEFDSINSRMTVLHGSGSARSKGAQRTGIARGTTPTIYHLSEVSAFPDPEQQIEAAIFRSVHASPKVFGVLESTFAGDTGWFPNKYKFAKEQLKSGGVSRLYPLFFSWPCNRDLYPTKSWIRSNPVPGGWKPEDKVLEQILKAELFLQNSSLLSKYFGCDWRMPIEQQWYYHTQYVEHDRSGSLPTLLQEMPCLTGDTRISTENGMIRLDSARGSQRCESGKITGFWPKGEKQVHIIITTSGRSIRATPNHLFQTSDGWKAVSELKRMDRLVLLPPMFAEVPYVETWDWSPICQMSVTVDGDLASFLGYFMGDGCYHSNAVDISVDAKDLDVVREVVELLKRLTGRGTITTQRVGGMVRVRCHSIKWFEILNNLGCLQVAFHKNLGRGCGYKRKVCVPEAIFRSPRLVVQKFLSALFECDGHATKSTPRVKFWSKHEDFLQDIQILLLGFEVDAKLMSQQLKSGAGGIYTGRSLEIPAAFANRFYDEIGFISIRKQTTGKRCTSGKVAILEDKISLIFEKGLEEVYDISVDRSHYFSANGLKSHNCDDIEAMQSSYDNVFGREVIHLCQRNRDRDFKIYAIVGTAIDSTFDPDPDEIDYRQPRIALRHTPPREDTHYEWELIPLKTEMFDELTQGDPTDSDLVQKYAPLADAKLFVFPDAMKPDTFETSLGIDTSNGIAADSSVISGCTKGNGLVPDIQLVSFRSEYINHVQAFAFAMPIALYLKSLNHNPNALQCWPYCGIEQIAAVGDTCQVQLRRMGYPTGRFFRFGRYDGLELNKKSSQKVGWYTVRWSRDLLIGYMVHAIKNGWYKPNSPWLIDECRTFEIHFTTTGKEKMEHSSTAHDDEIFGSAISTFINHDLDTLADRGNRKLMPKQETEIPDIDLLPNDGLRVNPDQILRVSHLTVDRVQIERALLDRFRY